MPRRQAATVSLPAAVFSDTRLAVSDLRVLGVLRSFCARGEGPFSLDRKAIASAAAIHETAVSRATRRLEMAGWIRKADGGHRSSSKLYRFTFGKGDSIVTLSDAEKGNSIVTLSGSKRVTALSPNDPERVTALLPNRGERVTALSPFPGAQRARISNNINIYTDTDPDLESVDSQNEGTDGDSAKVLEILLANGMPEAYTSRSSWQDDQAIIRRWFSDDFTIDDIRTATEQAADRKRDGKPIGVRYVDACLRNNQNNTGRQHEDFRGTDYRAGTW